MTGVVIVLGFTGCSPCRAPHLDVGVMMGTVDAGGPTRLACVM